MTVKDRKRNQIPISLNALFAMLAWFIFVSFSGAQANQQANNLTTLTAVVHHDYQPTAFQDPKTKKAKGFAIDLMDEIAKRAGFQVSYRFENDWTEIVEAVRTGKADLAPAIGITAEREKTLAFTLPFDTIPISMHVRSNSSLSGIKNGITIGAIKGSAAHNLLKLKHKEVDIRTYVSYSSGLLDLLSGHIDAFCCPEPTLMQLAKDAGFEDKIKVVGSPLAEIKRAIALHKDNRELLAKLNAATKEFVGSPEYNRLYDKWHASPKPLIAVSGKTVLITLIIFLVIGAMALWRYISLAHLNQRLQSEIEERKRTEEELLKREQQLQALNANLADGMVYQINSGLDGLQRQFTYLSAALERLHGLKIEDVKQNPMLLYDQVVEEDRAVVSEKEAYAYVTRTRLDIDVRVRIPSGEVRWRRFISAPHTEPDGSLVWDGIEMDITERKQAEIEREQFYQLFQTSADLMVIADPNGAFIRVNPACTEALGYNADELVSKPFIEFVHSEDKQPTLDEMAKQLQRGFSLNFENRYQCKNGSFKLLSWRATYIKEQGITYATARDITELRQAEEQIQRSLKEKEVLLKEIHHRVKNNMQVIYSLLSLQAKGIDDEAVRAKFEESRSRVLSMSLVHDKLYRSEDLAHIDFKDYLQSLVKSIADTYKRHDVTFFIDMEPILLDVNVGVPCGLIVNELVSNSLKYAFPQNINGNVKVGIKKSGKENYILFIEDNGIGFPADIDFRNTLSLGMQLVNGLTRQIGGKIELSRTEGTSFAICFPCKQEPGDAQNG
ncbi:MAG: transporter substrate-binding domain-containing protein [Nitrospirae bacterium]|nr:transporter substrate-binding domain-containing protein [Nitrospirota bacterium]